MKLLAVDTATHACSVALSVDGVIDLRTENAPRRHGRTVLPMITDLLATAGLDLQALDALAFGRGPGGFTGLRIAAGVIQGLALAAHKPVVPVSDLAALAQQVLDTDRDARVLACMDARMDELYWGTFVGDDDDLAVALGAEALGTAEAVDPGAGDWRGIGTGFSVVHGIGARFPGAADAAAARALPGAAEIARLAVRDFNLGRAVDAAQAQPVYLRNEVAWRKPSG